MPKKDPQRIARKLRLGHLRAHVLVCTGGDCGSRRQQKDALKEARRQVKELGLDRGDGRVVCTGVDCLKICHGGPIAVVWPDGTFYRDATPGNLRRIVREHVGEGRVVEELCIARPEG